MMKKQIAKLVKVQGILLNRSFWTSGHHPYCTSVQHCPLPSCVQCSCTTITAQVYSTAHWPAVYSTAPSPFLYKCTALHTAQLCTVQRHNCYCTSVQHCTLPSCVQCSATTVTVQVYSTLHRSAVYSAAPPPLLYKCTARVVAGPAAPPSALCTWLAQAVDRDQLGAAVIQVADAAAACR